VNRPANGARRSMAAPLLAAGVLWLLAAVPVLSSTDEEGTAETAAEVESAATPETIPADSVAGPVRLVETAATVVTDVLQGKDGVRVQTLCTHCNSANVQVGGLSRDLVPMSRDGFPLVGGLATSFVLSMLPADSIAEAQVVKGPGDAALSGAAAGGEVNLFGSSATEVPWFDFFAEAGSYSLQRASTRLAGSLSSWADGTIVLGTTNADPVDDDGDGWNDVPAVDRGFAEGTLRLAPGSNHRVLFGVSYIDEENLQGRGAFDAVRYISEGQNSWTREDALFDRQEIRAGWEWRSPANGTLELRALVAGRDQTVSSQLTSLSSGFIDGADQLIDRFEIEEQDLWGSLSYEQPIGLSWRIGGGVEASRQEVDAINREPLQVIGGGPVQEQTGLESVDLVSAYLEVGWSPSPAWDVQLGIRHDEAESLTRLSHPEPSRSKRSDNEVSPRVSVHFFPARGWMLRFIAGDTFRAAKPILAEVCCGQRYQTIENVTVERGTTVGLEAEYVPFPRLRASVYVARTDFDDHILRVVGWSQVFVQTWALANVPESRADRAELALRWSPWAPLTLDGTVGWLSFENRGNEKVDLHVAPPSFGGTIVVPITIGRIPYQAVRSGSIAAALTFPGRVLVSAQASYTGEMSIQQFDRLPLNSTLDTEEMRKTPGFWLVNASAEIPLSRHVSILGTINNVTDRIQNDLGDPTTDYNWGPLAGRSWQAGIKVHLGRR